MTPGKTIALTRWTFVSKAMSLLFNTHILIAIYKGGTSATPMKFSPKAAGVREFPGGLVVRIPGFHRFGSGSIPGQD